MLRTCLIRVVSVATMAAISIAAMTPAAAEFIGSATLIERDVHGVIDKARVLVKRGDRVERDEVIETSASSSAQFEFLDKTKLSIGPSSQVKLDEFAYSGGGKASKVAIELLLGGFRFVSGKSGRQAYEIRTPHAVIGVRGTTIGFIVTAQSTTVILKQGGITVCRRGTRVCADARSAEQRIIVRNDNLQGPLRRRANDPDFADWCRDRKARCGL